MRLPRKIGVSVGLAAILLSACGKGYGTGSNGSSAPPVGDSAALLSASISGIGTVLEASNGFTIYHLTTEVGGQIECTGGCRATWPPVLASGAVPALPGGVPGTLSTVNRPDGGVQLTFNGMPLYTYSGDSGPGQSNGQGIGGVWFAVTSSGTTVPPAGGRYGSPTPSGY
jgi:predicted lipoprotein with Yx(FWY)xxD motif